MSLQILNFCLKCSRPPCLHLRRSQLTFGDNEDILKYENSTRRIMVRRNSPTANGGDALASLRSTTDRRNARLMSGYDSSCLRCGCCYQYRCQPCQTARRPSTPSTSVRCGSRGFRLCTHDLPSITYTLKMINRGLIIASDGKILPQ